MTSEWKNLEPQFLNANVQIALLTYDDFYFQGDVNREAIRRMSESEWNLYKQIRNTLMMVQSFAMRCQ